MGDADVGDVIRYEGIEYIVTCVHGFNLTAENMNNGESCVFSQLMSESEPFEIVTVNKILEII